MAVLLALAVAETGDDISDCIDSECLLLVNHQSTGDVPVIMQALTDANKRRLSRKVCWILDDMFRYANFELPCHVHGDFFILQVQVSVTLIFTACECGLVILSVVSVCLSCLTVTFECLDLQTSFLVYRCNVIISSG